MRTDILPYAPLLMPELLQKLGDNKTLVRQVQYGHFNCFTSRVQKVFADARAAAKARRLQDARSAGTARSLYLLY
jgi:hypothetical protein